MSPWVALCIAAVCARGSIQADGGSILRMATGIVRDLPLRLRVQEAGARPRIMAGATMTGNNPTLAQTNQRILRGIPRPGWGEEGYLGKGFHVGGYLGRGGSHSRSTTKVMIDPIVAKTSLSAMSELFAQIGIGYLAVRTGLLDSTILPGISRTVFNVMLPALLCTSVAKTVAECPLRTLFPIPLLALAQIMVGIFISRIVLRTVRLSTNCEAGRETTVLSAFHNSGNLPLSLVSALFWNDPVKLERATAIIAVFLLGWSPVFWSLGKSMLTGPTETDIAAANKSQELPKDFKFFLKRASRTVINVVKSPPIAGCLTGCVIGSVPFLGRLFLKSAEEESPPLGIIFNALKNTAKGYMPLSVLVLAGTMAQRSETSARGRVKGDKRRLWLILLLRFVLIPLTSLTVINLAVNLRWITNDPILIFILLLQSTMPSAQNCVTMLQVEDKPLQAQRVARTQLQVYLASILPVSLWITYFLQHAKVM